jgi:hypothetical protein
VVSGLPGPVLVVYEAGPTGFGLARRLAAAGVECLVAAPSRLQRPSRDRVKTVARDAEHLARPAGRLRGQPGDGGTDAGPQEPAGLQDRRPGGNGPVRPVVRALMCLRGISALTAFGLAVEIGDRTRFMVHQDDSGCRGASSAHFSGVDSGVDLQALLRRLLFLPLQCFFPPPVCKRMRPQVSGLTFTVVHGK